MSASRRAWLAAIFVLVGMTVVAPASAQQVTPRSHDLDRPDTRGDSYRIADLDVTASAQPSESMPTITNTAVRTVHVYRAGKAIAAALSSATCDRCEATATTVSVVAVSSSARTPSADNVAAAWATCTDCTAQALSIQLVLTRVADARIVVANRALATTAACVRCRVTATAVQIVFIAVSRTPRPATLAQLAGQLRADLEQSVRNARNTATVRLASAPDPTTLQIVDRYRVALQDALGARNSRLDLVTKAG